MPIAPFLAWVQSTRVATTIGESSLLTALLSGAHLVGLTLIVGAVLVSSLRLLGIVLTDRPAVEITAPTGRGVIAGLTLSVSTGLLLFMPRAAAAAENSFFQIKMALLFAAVLFHFTVSRGVRLQPAADESPAVKFTGGVQLILWLGVAFAGCAFILLE